MKTGAGGKGCGGARGGLAAGGHGVRGWVTRTASRAKASRSARGWPRRPLRAGKAAISSIVACASASSKGAGAEGHVLEGLDEDSAEPEHEDCPERGVALHAEVGLHPSRHHGGDAVAINRCVRLRGAEGGEALVESRLGGGTVGDAEDEARIVAVRRGELDRLVEVGRVNACPWLPWQHRMFEFPTIYYNF